MLSKPNACPDSLFLFWLYPTTAYSNKFDLQMTKAIILIKNSLLYAIEIKKTLTAVRLT